jgi:hypothetical protein
MSEDNEILNKVKLKGDWKPDMDFYKKSLELLLEEVTGGGGYYYRRSKAARAVLNDSTFSFMWDKHPGKREELLTDILDNNGYRENPYSDEYRLSVLSAVYEKVPVDLDSDNNRMRARLIPHVSVNYDYLAELNKFGLTDDTEALYDIWKHVGMNNSKDPNFYDYMWAKVKRAPGSVKKRISIVEAAFENDALSKKMLMHVAKRGTKNLKRSLTTSFADEMSNLRRSHYRLERNSRDSVGSEKVVNDRLLERSQKSIDVVEEKLMLFVDCDDERVVASLVESLSKDNLPWLMPAASKHYWLSRRLQEKIEEK